LLVEPAQEAQARQFTSCEEIAILLVTPLQDVQGTLLGGRERRRWDRRWGLHRSSSTPVVGRPEGDTLVTSSTFHATPRPWEIHEKHMNM
jgi:hypothetical protein